ncbi:MAG TPA: Spy/CpxP family protein refolding chaperone [Pyrinomonadaceae bacterium]|jgi:protein CpxP|nr:Spy/CpxP family protein refolding chaperone [Pyrinomonadaceae bacterium]
MKRLGKVKTLVIAGLSTVALAAPIAIAQRGGGVGQGKGQGQHGKWGGHGGGGMGMRRGGHFGGGGMFRGVDLTDEQKTRLQQIRQGFGERTKSLREQLRAKHQELRQSEQGATFNEALATQKLTEAAAIQARLMAEEFRLRQESLSVLTPEQKTQMEQRRAQFKAQGGGGRHGRRQQQQQKQQ